MKLTTVLIANRGEIACRIIRAAHKLGLRAIAVYSTADARALHVRMADAAIAIGPAPARQSYLDAARLIAAAQQAGADCVHPGYGFLSENADFAEMCAAAGLVFVGPPASAIRAMGLKDRAKALMQQAGVPVVPGYHGEDQSDARLLAEAERIGFPVLIKAVAGGGGKGMRRVDDAGAFAEALASARREALAAFGNDSVLVEKFIANPRHVEIQIFADVHGHVVHLGERDCSLQRRHQKVIEEAPAPGMTIALRERMGAAAVAAARAAGYVGAGTVEFILDGAAFPHGDFYFMEMNTRLQVEHPVTEAVTGVDLVEWQFRIAAGESLPLTQAQIPLRGCAVEARLYAEDPTNDFLPSIGLLRALRLPQGEGLRVDAGVSAGDSVTSHYDPIIAKIVAHGATRDEALDRLSHALGGALVAGPRTNIAFLKALCDAPGFRAGRFDTGFIASHLAELGARPRELDARAIALAVCAQARATAPSEDASGMSPWDARDAFQLAGARRVEMPFVVDGRTLRATLEWFAAKGALTVRVGDATFDAKAPLASDEHVVVDGETIFVLRAGVQTEVDFSAAARAAPAAGGEASGVVVSPMPGRVVALHVGRGDDVVKGHRLAVVEAMKMEHAILAPADGRIADVLVREGAQVGRGEALIRIEAIRGGKP